MFYKRGPIGLVILSIIVLVAGMGFGTITGLNNSLIYVLIVFFGSPWISKQIYISLKTNSLKEKHINEKYKENKEKFLKDAETRKELFYLREISRLKYLESTTTQEIEENKNQYEIINAIYEKLKKAYIDEYNLEYQCSECKQPLKNSDKTCPFCGEKTK